MSNPVNSAIIFLLSLALVSPPPSRSRFRQSKSVCSRFDSVDSTLSDRRSEKTVSLSLFIALCLSITVPLSLSLYFSASDQKKNICASLSVQGEWWSWASARVRYWDENVMVGVGTISNYQLLLQSGTCLSLFLSSAKSREIECLFVFRFRRVQIEIFTIRSVCVCVLC